VVGDAMLDVYLSGDVDRISPEAPVPVVRVRERRYALGGACNVAQNVVAMGARCDLAAAVGNDAAGHALRAMLGAMGAHDGTLVDVKRPSTQKTRDERSEPESSESLATHGAEGEARQHEHGPADVFRVQMPFGP
jgi:bifunctional ADP-heptose synthase (sugar kinase/adenylyltransferase)